MEWLVTYQDTPFSMTKPAVLVIDAETKDDAFNVAVDHLHRRGLKVYIAGSVIDASGCHGRTHIRSVVQYVVKPKGRVIEPDESR